MTIGDLLSSIANFFYNLRIELNILFNNILNTKIEDVFFLFLVLGAGGLAVTIFYIYKRFVEELNNKYLRFILHPITIFTMSVILIICFSYFVSYCYNGTYNTNNPINTCFD